MSSKSHKKLQMERLSPIPVLDQGHLPPASQTPVRAMLPSHRRQKDTYAIETTSSPEFGRLPVATSSSSLQKQRRYRNTAKGKIPKKPNSTPLSGLISRKTVSVTPKETLHFSDPYSSPTSNDMPSPCERSLVSVPGELPQIDDYSPQKPTHSPRHSEIFSASTVFPQKPQPSTSIATPLAGIVNKKDSNLNRSLNDSMLVLREAEDPSDDEEIASSTSLVNIPRSDSEKISIESFESPRKPRYVFPKEPTASGSIFKDFYQHPSKNLVKYNLYKATSIMEKSSSNSVEMCGNERKNRKRALNFNSTAFVVPVTDDVGDGRQSPFLSLMSPSCEHGDERKSPVLGLTSPSHNRELGSPSPILSLMPPCRDDRERCHSPISNLMSSSRNLDCQLPILNLIPPCRDRVESCVSPVLSLMSPSHDREHDCQSPILSLMSPSEQGEDRRSPVLNLMSPSHDWERDCQSPILSLVPPCRERGEVCRSPVLSLMSRTHRSKEASFEQLKPTKFPEIESVMEKEKEECPSDTDSVIESTPGPSRNRNQGSGSFTASSCLRIGNNSPPLDSPVKMDYNADFEIPKIVEILEETSDDKNNEKCGLKFVVVSHDTSPEDSINDSDEEEVIKNSCGILFPTIDGRHSPHLELNYTKRPIQSFETPSKAPKPFSEALNIGAFGSPDSNAPYGDHHAEEEKEDGTTDEVIEQSTTQEYIEESEQVRPNKRRKKGSLLERVRGVIAKVDASNALFDYEMKCGLRPLKGKFVSAPLVILKKSGEASSLFLVCKPLKYCANSSHVEDLASFVVVHVNKLPSDVSFGSVVLLHFPVTAMYFSNLHIPCVLAGHQIVPHPTEQKIDVRTIDASSLESIKSFSLAYSKPITSFRTFSSVVMRTLSEAALCQNLVEESHLYLTVLHVTKLYVDAVLKKISVLCCDEEFLPCWVEFSSGQDMSRAAALETLHILSDGSQVQTKGFCVVDRARLDRKTKNLISYCSNNVVNSEIIFFVRPKEFNWVISSTEGLNEVKKVPSSISDVLSAKSLGCRYLIEVHGVEEEPQIVVKDSQGQSIRFVLGQNSCVSLDHPVPFFLDAVYFYEGQLFSDEHTRVILKI